MRNIYRSLLMLIASSTQKELARHVRYLKTENEIPRSKLSNRVALTPQERNRLCRFARNLGSALNELVTTVHPDTIRRWIRESGAPNIRQYPRLLKICRQHANIDMEVIRQSANHLATERFLARQDFRYR
jgi:putative transposase